VNVFYCLPHSGTWIPEGIPSATQPSLNFDVQPRLNRSTFLNHSFNQYWCEALNQNPRPTYWAMHHADMSAEPGWLDVLIDIMEEYHADVVSAVACIKDQRGLTNAATHDGSTLRWLSVNQCEMLPDVFDWGAASAVQGIKDDCALLVNTGMWVVRFDRPWVERFPGFSFSNGIVRRTDGKYEAKCMSEDWKFSLWAKEENLRVLATTRVKTFHHGNYAWSVGGPR